MKRMWNIIVRYADHLVHFGPRLTFYLLTYPRFCGRKGMLRRHVEIKRYLKRRYSAVFAKYSHAEAGEGAIHDDAPIWVCWLQGEDEMPELVRVCYSSVLRWAVGRPVNLVTEKNLEQWVQVPDIIQKKHREGLLSCTHYADYIRILLLREHGGMWVDATVYVSGPMVQDRGLRFFSLKMKPKSACYVSNYKWTVSLLSSVKKYPLFFCLEELFRRYVSDHRRMIDFFLLDYLIACIYDECPSVREDIDAVPMNTADYYELGLHLEDPGKADALRAYEGGYWKLSRKKAYRKFASSGEKTLYGYITQEGDKA